MPSSGIATITAAGAGMMIIPPAGQQQQQQQEEPHRQQSSLGRSLSAKLSMVRQIVDLVCWSPKQSDAHHHSHFAETNGDSSPPPLAVAAAPGKTKAKRCPYSALLKNPDVPYEFQMPLHYPRYSKEQYKCMPEWQIDRLLEEYGLPASDMGCLDDKRDYAIGAFLWS